jgi:hypothetical protein
MPTKSPCLIRTSGDAGGSRQRRPAAIRGVWKRRLQAVEIPGSTRRLRYWIPPRGQLGSKLRRLEGSSSGAAVGICGFNILYVNYIVILLESKSQCGSIFMETTGNNWCGIVLKEIYLRKPVHLYWNTVYKNMLELYPGTL